MAYICYLCLFSYSGVQLLPYYISLRSLYQVVMSATISGKKRCPIRIYRQLFVGGRMSYLRYFLRVVVSNTSCLR
jgi:hypothetical protein